MFKSSRRLVRPVVGRFQSIRSTSYKLPSISTLDSIRIANENFKGLLSNRALNEVWFKRGNQLIDGLNQLLEDNQFKNPPSDLNDLISMTINKQELYGIYAYATLIHNLQFYMESLKTNDEEFADARIRKCDESELLKTSTLDYVNRPKDENLNSWIQDSFGSMDEFRTLLLNSAKAIKGDGFVWLVAESNLSEFALKNSSSNVSKGPIYNHLSVVNTYNAGAVDDSLRSGQITKLKLQKQARLASLKKKQVERKSINGETEEDIEEISSLEKEIDELVLGTVEEAEANTIFSDKKLLPLLCIDASPRNYLLDYGIFGKQQYLDNVWECIDWNVVSMRLPQRSKQFLKLD